MNRSALIGGLISAVLLAPTSYGLSRCDGPNDNFDGYPNFLLEEMHRRSPKRVLFSYIVMPSVSLEYGFVLTKSESAYTLSAVTFTRPVWYGSMERSESGHFALNLDSERVKALVTHVALDEKVAEDLVAQMSSELSSTKDDQRSGLDGVIYRLYGSNGSCAEAWSPDPGTHDRAFVDALDALRISVIIPTSFFRSRWHKRIIRKWKEASSS